MAGGRDRAPGRKKVRYHFQPVDQLPPSVDRRSRPSPLQRILNHARTVAHGQWVLAATYASTDGAKAAVKRLTRREQQAGRAIDWEYAVRKATVDGQTVSHLYVRVRGDEQRGEL